MLERLAKHISSWALRWVPDPWVLAIIITLVAFALAFFLAPGLNHTELPVLPADLNFARAGSLIYYWGAGFWALSGFAMQMCLIILTGYMLAVSKPLAKALTWIAALPKTPRSTIAMVAFLSMLLSFVHWGLSIVASAFLAKAVMARNSAVNRPLLIAAAYLGLGTTWHAGLSASAPLLVSTPGHFLESEIGLIPITQTVLHPLNLMMAALTIAGMTFFVPRLSGKEQPQKTSLETPPPAAAEGSETPRPRRRTPAERLESSPLLNIIVALGFGGTFLFLYFTHGQPNSLSAALSRFNLDIFNMMFLMLAVLLLWRPSAVLAAARDAGGCIWPVILQFPFYAGAYGIIKHSGLQDVIAGWFTSAASAQTYPVFVYWYSGVLNYLVPSGGSKWAIEAPYVLKAGAELGVPNALLVLSYAWGDMMTDIIQPFWALPLLSIAKIEFREMAGYCLLIFLPYFAFVSICFMSASFLFPW